MSYRIATFKYAGHDVPIRTVDGYVNVTALCQAERKRAGFFMRGPAWREFTAVVSLKLQICNSSLIESRRGRGAETWAHPTVASWIAERLSPEAAFFVHDTLTRLHLAGVVVEIAERTMSTPQEQLTNLAEAIADKITERQEQRITPLPWVCQLHRRCAGNVCPRCSETVAKLEIDHFYSRSDAALHATWPICRRCNLARRRLSARARLLDRALFDAYQDRLRTFAPEEFADLFQTL